MTEVWTLGHSTRTIEEFLAALQAFKIQTLIDVRRFPTSKRNPQYDAVELKKTLHAAGVRYVYLGDELGGMRRPSEKSRHSCLKGSGFQAYADWMDTDAFLRGIEKLVPLAESGRTAIMCAERAPSACHRSLLGDFLVLVRGFIVNDIRDPGNSGPHAVTPTARASEGRVIYDRRAEGEGLKAFPEDADAKGH